ncbi:MAG: hypothetical protein FJ318_07005 [SAR202 cluster bacterium]|nr:hypothetical protein [SAR202 cluster bacterium]
MAVKLPRFGERINVVTIRVDNPQQLQMIRDVAPGRVDVTSLWDSLQDDLKREWPAFLVDRFNPPGFVPKKLPRAEVDKALREADAVVIGFPYLRDLRARMPRVQWLHCAFAGVSNVRESDFWGSDVFATSARGHTGALPIAETALAGVFMFAKKLNLGVRQTVERTFNLRAYTGIQLIEGKTLGIIGLGGIGRDLARLAKGVGMRVVATRKSAARRERDVDGVDELFPAAGLLEMLPQCDYVVVAAMWTLETERMVNKAAFDAMKDGAVLINIARGEIVDEQAMIAALHAGKLGGAYLDVYTDEFYREPDPALTSLPNVVMTPHISVRADVNQSFGIEVFRAYLKQVLEGRTPENVIDWERGY